MSDQINVSFVQQYKSNVELLLQQMGSRLRKAVAEDTYTGKAAKVVEQIGAVTPRKRTTRHADTPQIDTPHDARWVFPFDYDWGDLIDDPDKIRALADFKSPYAVNGAKAMGRAIDEEIIAAFFGTALTGENGTTTTTHTGNGGTQVAVAASGLTVAKLREAKLNLMAADVDIDNDPLWCAITAQQHDDLLGETQAISLDYTTRPVLVEGRITAFMGFNFIHTELLEVNATPDRRVPAWAQSGMHLGLWQDITTEITIRPDKSYSTGVYVAGTFGATRTEEEKIVEIICSES